jgi:urocanate hydratase
MLQMAAAGAIVFEYGDHLRGQAAQAGVPEAAHLPSFVTLFARDLLCAGITPLRWVALSGDVGDIYRVDRWLLDRYGDDERLITWLQWAQERVHFQGLPARSAWLTREEQADLLDFVVLGVREGRLRAPLAITRDHFAGATMASPHRETEAMPDGSDAIADWPVLNALLTTATGATLVSLQQGGGVGIGYSMHAGMTVVVDGTPENAKRAKQTLQGELRLGVTRYAQAGYSVAKTTLAEWQRGEPT